MPLENHQQLHRTFFECYIDQDTILLKNDLQKQLCHLFFEFYTARNRIKKIKASSKCFLTLFLNHSGIRKHSETNFVVEGYVLTASSNIWVIKDVGRNSNARG